MPKLPSNLLASITTCELLLNLWLTEGLLKLRCCTLSELFVLLDRQSELLLQRHGILIEKQCFKFFQEALKSSLTLIPNNLL